MSVIHCVSRAVIVDQGHLLLCKTLDLPKNFYFLPGGHIEPRERAQDALLRELQEETGKQGQILRFLGCVEYLFEPGHSSICHDHEYVFVFEVRSPLKLQDAIPKLEKHIELLWMPLEKIGTIDLRAEPLRELLPQWLKGGNANAI